MAWYVFALVDAVPSGAAGKGLRGALSLRKLGGAYVVVERRADVPPVEFGTLKKHQEVVSRLAKHVPAILPVRFGTLLEPADLEAAVQERDDEIADAFELVRRRVQFTWRMTPGRKADGERQKAPRRVTTPVTGTAYLRQAARAANPAPPAAFRGLRAGVAPLTVRQRYQPGTATLPEAMYHLVEQSEMRRYRAEAAAFSNTSRLLAVTGPFPPYAFAPEIL